MATIKNTISLQDRMTPVLKAVIKSLNSTVAVMATTDRISSTAFDAMKKDIMEATAQLENLNSEVDDLPGGAKTAASAFGGFKNPLVTASAAIYTIQSALRGITSLTNIADEFTMTNARLNIMNDGLQTTAELQDMILASAQRSRAEYGATAAAVSRMGILAGDNFKSSEEIVAFTELLNKSFKVGGAGLQEQSSAMYQLSQAMAAGKLQGDEFRAIMENAPMLASAIAEYMGKTKGELKSMSSEGVITADIIKNALFGAAGDIESKFSQLPMTVGDVMTRIKNMTIEAFQPMFERLTALVNAPQFQTFINNMVNGLQWLGNAAVTILNGTVEVVNWAATNWAILEPIIWGLVAAFGAMQIIGIVGGMVTAYTTALAAATAAGQTLTVVQWLLNLAVAANPFGLMAYAIVAVIAALVALGVWLWNLWQTNIDFKVGVLGIWNSILNFFDLVPIAFQWVGNAIADVFSNLKISVLTDMQTLINGVIDMVNGLISILNKIPGVAIQPLNKMSFAAQEAAKETAAQQARAANLAESRATADAKAAQRARDLAQYEDASRQKARQEQERLANQEKQAEAPGFNFGDFVTPKMNMNPTGGKLDSVDKINEDVSISDEDIKMLRDVAAVEFVNRYTTLTPNMTINFGDVHETADVNGVLSAIENMLDEAYSSSLVGG